MASTYEIVVLGSLVPDPLQTLEPILGPSGPVLRNDAMLPRVLDPWAAHALYEAAHLAAAHPSSSVTLVVLGPKVKLQQLMTSVGQKVPFELLALDAPESGFTEAAEVAAALAEAIKGLKALDISRLLLFGGWESASRGSGATLAMTGEILGIRDQFQGVDRVRVADDGSLEVLERASDGCHQVSRCEGPPAVFGWATGTLAEPPNNPQIGMANMRGAMPAMQRAKRVELPSAGLAFREVLAPKQRRVTRVVADRTEDEMALEIAGWIKGS